eukprot:1157607-Pelagomonas_calceolata.AAC.3
MLYAGVRRSECTNAIQPISPGASAGLKPPSGVCWGEAQCLQPCYLANLTLGISRLKSVLWCVLG